jgi:hypothetical protein
MTEKQETCAERLPRHLASRLDDFEKMIARDDPDELTEAEEEDINAPGPLSEYPLGASVRFAVRVELSTGGPADYLEAIVDGDGGIERITYHFADWFDHAEQSLSGDDFDTAEAFITALYGHDLAYSLRESIAPLG